MDILKFVRGASSSAQMSRSDFLRATRLTAQQFDRLVAEGGLDAHWVPREGQVVENASEFINKMPKKADAHWPPPTPSLNMDAEDQYARSGGEQHLAATIMEPFRYQVMGDTWDKVIDVARPSARLLPGAPGGVGSSKIGGLPDVPRGFVWPRFDDVPLGFVAQVNLREVQAVCPNHHVPANGVLSFFYDAEQQGWGFDPKDRGRWSVQHFEGALVAAEFPPLLPVEGRYAEAPLRAVGELTLPEEDSLEIEHLALTDRQRRAYGALMGELEEARGKRGPIHRMLGWPEEVQRDPAAEVQLPANGLYAGDGKAYASDEGKRLMAERDVWHLVLQVDSDDVPGMMWGDVGRLYFMMRRDDLGVRNWEAAWLSFQCS